MVTNRADLLGKSRIVKTPFSVLPCKSIYNCIIGRPTLGWLGVVASTVHLKMKFYSLENEVITLDVDLASAKQCHFLSLKSEEEYDGSKEVDSKKRVRKQEREPEMRV